MHKTKKKYFEKERRERGEDGRKKPRETSALLWVVFVRFW